MPLSITVVVPVLDEATGLGACLAAVGPPEPDLEILVVDGGSRDATPEVARARGIPVLASPRGRALQQNAGAARARGEVLVFLHADVRLPSGWREDVRRILADPQVVGGGFPKRYQPCGPSLAASAWLQNRIRSGLLGDFVGTNAIFVRSRVFRELGGFPEVPLLEDVLFSDRMKGRGPVRLARHPVTVSARKYHAEGAFLRMLRNIWIMIQFRILGRSPHRLAGQYYRR